MCSAQNTPKRKQWWSHASV